MSQPRVKLPDRVRAALTAVSLPWAIKTSRSGTTHAKVRIAGRFVGIVPITGGSDVGRAERNLVAQIRRAYRRADGGGKGGDGGE